MNARRFNRWLVVGLAAVLLPLALVLMLSMRGLVRELIVVPLSYLYWVGDLLIRSTPQGLFWAVLIITGIIIAWRSLYVVNPPLLEKVSNLEIQVSRRQRVGFWAYQVHMLRQGVARARFADFISRLGMEVLAFREQTTPVEVEARLLSGELDAPEILAYLRLRRMTPSEDLRLFLRLAEWLGEWKQRIFGRRSAMQGSAPEVDLRRTLDILEEHLEVKHDIWNNHAN